MSDQVLDHPREGSPPFGDQIAAFLDDLLLAGRSPATIRTYRFFIRKLPGPTSDACRNLMRYYVPRIKSAQTCYAALACFGRYQVDQGWAAESPMARIPFPRGKPPAPRSFLTTGQLQAVYAACTSDRDRLMIRLLLTGLRVSELCGAKRAELRGDKLTIRGKGGFTRAVMLDSESLAMLNQATGTRLLPMCLNTVRAHLRTLGRRTGIPGITPHSFRRTMASQALLAGMDSLHVRTLGGWRNEAVFSQRYVAYVLEDAALAASRRVNLTGQLLGEDE